MKMNAGLIQDLFHYSLAMQGKANGLDAHTLKQRLDNAESAYNSLSLIEEERVSKHFELVIPHFDRWQTEKEMVEAGKMLQESVQDYAMSCLIDPNTGEELQLRHNNP